MRSSARQHADGYWLFELEADCTIPAEYIMMMHFLDEIDAALEAKIANYLRARAGRTRRLAAVSRRRSRLELHRQGVLRAEAGGRRCRDAPHMARARAAILERGGAARANVFTRIALALFGAAAVARRALYSRRDHAAAEVVSVSPRQGLVLVAHGDGAAVHPVHAQAGRQEPAATCDIRELFTTAPEKERHYFRRAGFAGQGIPGCSIGSAA